jgi:uncharacterized protein (DUF305 family)
MMIHHEQAVVMAQTVRGRADPQVAQLAYGIESNQLLEIGQMQGNLGLWRKPRLPTGEPMAWMHDADHIDHMTRMGNETGDSMPGMATQNQLTPVGITDRAESRSAPPLRA